MLDELSESTKTLGVTVVAWVVSSVIHNPIGAATGIVGLLYVFEKWRTQKLIRKQLENKN